MLNAQLNAHVRAANLGDGTVGTEDTLNAQLNAHTLGNQLSNETQSALQGISSV